MPLSEHEQKMLEQMEQALAAEDPRFASQMKGSGFTGPRGRRAILGALGVLLGLGTVLAAVWTTKPRGQSSFMDRLDERWDRREDGN